MTMTMADESLASGDDEDERAYFERLARGVGVPVWVVERSVAFLERREAGQPDLDDDREALESLVDRDALDMDRAMAFFGEHRAEYGRLDLDREEAKLLVRQWGRRERAHEVFRRLEDPDAVPRDEMRRLLEEAGAFFDADEARWAALLLAEREFRRRNN
jgi:hypothetical protein